MSKDDKIKFIDKVVGAFKHYCPQMSEDVLFFVACQFALESNFGRARMCSTKNNFCGMKVPVRRLSLNQDTTGFASFSSFENCVIDYIYWLCWNNFDYFTLFDLDLFTRKLIAKKYCPESDYIDRVYSIYNQLKS